jgi:hypothetical protein
LSARFHSGADGGNYPWAPGSGMKMKSAAGKSFERRMRVWTGKTGRQRKVGRRKERLGREMLRKHQRLVSTDGGMLKAGTGSE